MNKLFLILIPFFIVNTLNAMSVSGTMNLDNYSILQVGRLSNTGTIGCENNSQIIGDVLIINGQIVSKTNAIIKCKTCLGKGLIKINNATIEAEDFSFAGTIECNGLCTIQTKQPVKKLFKETGNGKLNIPNLYSSPTSTTIDNSDKKLPFPVAIFLACTGIVCATIFTLIIFKEEPVDTAKAQ